MGTTFSAFAKAKRIAAFTSSVMLYNPGNISQDVGLGVPQVTIDSFVPIGISVPGC
jgi:hypothetical protein